MQPNVYIFTDDGRSLCRYCMLFALRNSKGGSIAPFVGVSCVFLGGYGTNQSISEAHHQTGRVAQTDGKSQELTCEKCQAGEVRKTQQSNASYSSLDST